MLLMSICCVVDVIVIAMVQTRGMAVGQTWLSRQVAGVAGVICVVVRMRRRVFEGRCRKTGAVSGVSVVVVAEESTAGRVWLLGTVDHVMIAI